MSMSIIIHCKPCYETTNIVFWSNARAPATCAIPLGSWRLDFGAKHPWWKSMTCRVMDVRSIVVTGIFHL